MVKRKLTASIIIIFYLIFLIPDTSYSAPKIVNQKVSLNFVDVEISTIVRFISEVTGKNFLYDDKLKGTITIISPTKMSTDAAFDLFTLALELKGFTISLSGDVYKIVPISSARQTGFFVNKEVPPLTPGGQYIVKIIQLKHIPAQIAVITLQPLISKDGYILSSGGNNLMIVDSALNMEKLLSIVSNIDKEVIEEPELLYLKHTNADDVVRTISDVMANQFPGQSIGKESIVADSRLNALIFLGSKAKRDTIKNMVAILDIPSPIVDSKINVYNLEYASAEEVAKIINETSQGIIDHSKPSAASRIIISADKSTNSLVIVASPAHYQNILQIIKKLDVKPKQVLVEAMIVEVSLANLNALGVKWRGLATSKGSPIFVGGVGIVDSSSMLNIVQGLSGLLVGGFGSFTNMNISTIKPDGTIATQSLTAPKFAAIFNLDEFKGAVNVLSMPHILTADNKEAEIMVGENVPFVSKREASTSQVPSLLSTSIERKDIGITLRITPNISKGDFVRLNVYQEISLLKSNEPSDIIISMGPTTSKRSTKTTVSLKHGETVVIGGLLQEKEVNNESKVPFFSSIPLIGELFKYKSKEFLKTNLLIFLTPKIIKNEDDLQSITESKKNSYAEEADSYIEGQIVIKFKEQVSQDRINEIIKQEHGEIISSDKSIYLLKLPKNLTAEKAIDKFLSYKEEVEVAKPQYIFKTR